MTCNNKSIWTSLILSLVIFSSAYPGAPGDPERAQKKTIESIRKGVLHIKGKPGATVQVKQLNHEFWFGCAVASQVFSENSRMSESDIKMYKQKFLENFNSAVTENAVKWGSMERTRGKIDYKTADNILDWTDANQIPCRGHNLYWGIHQFVQDWVKELNDKELKEAVKKRGIETAGHYKGRFAHVGILGRGKLD